MKRRLRCTAAAVAALFAVLGSPLLGQEVSLRYLWKKGEVLRYRTTQQTAVNITGMPGVGAQSMTMSIVQLMRMTADDVAADGAATVRNTFDAVRVEMGLPTGPVVYDSQDSATSNPATNPMAKTFSAIVGESVTVVTASNGAVLKVQGMSKLSERLQQSLPQPGLAAVAGLDNFMSDEALTSMFQQGFSQLPARPVKAGDSWNSEVTIRNPLAAMTTSLSYTLSSIENRAATQLARIAVTMSLKAAEPAVPPNLGLPMTITVADGSGEGEIVLDLRAGRLQRSVMRSTQPMTMSMTMPDGTAMNMQMSNTSTITVELVED
jgi:hypothetical protein